MTGFVRLRTSLATVADTHVIDSVDDVGRYLPFGAIGVLGAVAQTSLYLAARTYTEKRVQARLRGAARALS